MYKRGGYHPLSKTSWDRANFNYKAHMRGTVVIWGVNRISWGESVLIARTTPHSPYTRLPHSPTHFVFADNLLRN